MNLDEPSTTPPASTWPSWFFRRGDIKGELVETGVDLFLAASRVSPHRQAKAARPIVTMVTPIGLNPIASR